MFLDSVNTTLTLLILLIRQTFHKEEITK